MKIVKNIKPLIIIFAIFVLGFVAYSIFVRFFEPGAYNYMVKNFSAINQGSDDIIIIAIDDKSLDRIRWPWKRELYGKIFEYLKYSDAKIIGFDAILRSPDAQYPESDSKFFSDIKNINNLIVGFAPLTSEYTNEIGGDYYDKKFKDKFSSKIKDERTKKLPSFYRSLSPFPPGYFNAVTKVGSVITTPDDDGYIRSIDQLVDYKDSLYPSLALRMYAYLNNDNFIIEDGKVTSTKTDLKIPTIKDYQRGVFNRMHYYKLFPNSEYSHKKYSAIDVIDSMNRVKQGKKPIISPDIFKGKIVLVGANAKAIAMGTDDVKKTPTSENFPGVDIQATSLDNILHNEFFTQTSTFTDLFILTILLGGTFLAIRYFSIFASLGIISLIIIIYIGFCAVLFRFNIAINVVTPIAFQLVTMIMAYSYKFFLEGQNKEKIKSAMGKYISQDVMQKVVKNIDGVKLGGKRANVTVLFADIRGFTSMSENMSAEEVSVILNDYFTEIEPIISKYNGVINKFIGDAVMAIFGEPIQDKNHAENAVKCANEMLKKVTELQKKWLEEGKPKIEIGVGINTGDAFVGNIGSEIRLEYTVIGDVVNLASRIESYNKVYKTHLLISSTTYEKVRNIADVIKISEVSIRGKAKKLDIYEVLRLVE